MSFFTDQSYSGVENTIVYLVSFCQQPKQYKQRRSQGIMRTSKLNFNSSEKFWNK